MKTYEEKTKSVFQKIEEAEARQRKRIGTFKRITVPVVGFCLVVAIGFGVWKAGTFQNIPPQTDVVRTPSEGPTGVKDAKDSTNAAVENQFNISADQDLIQWENKTVFCDLAEALSKAPSDKVFDILANPYIDYGFVYKGRTFNEYYCDMNAERQLPDILASLLKDGDSLKYGTSLYEGGAPNGEKWAKSLYDEKVAFYGTEILNKYIVNGEFLRSQVENDIKTAENATEATEAYKAARRAYYKHLVDTMRISVPADVKGTDGIVLHMTAEEFKDFTADHIEAWTFRLYTSYIFG